MEKRNCKNCKELDKCQRPIRQMASDEELEHIVCIAWSSKTNEKSFKCVLRQKEITFLECKECYQKGNHRFMIYCREQQHKEPKSLTTRIKRFFFKGD